MILVEFFDDFDRKKLALLEKDESFLERSCRESREQIISEIGELLPSKFRFIVWGSPLSLLQESTYSIRKCAIEISEKSDYPDNVSVYRVYLRAMKSEVLPETVPVSTCTITSAPSHVQVVNSTSHIGAKAIDRLVENLNKEKKSLEYRLQIAQATVSSLKEAPKERPTIGRNPSFTCSNCHFMPSASLSGLFQVRKLASAQRTPRGAKKGEFMCPLMLLFDIR